MRDGASHFWQGLMKVRELFLSLTRRVVGDGAKTLFWEDVWPGDKKVAELFPRLYNISFDKMITVKKAKSFGWASFTFRRTLHGEYLR